MVGKYIVVARATDGDFPAPAPVIADVAEFLKGQASIERCIVHVATPGPMESPMGKEPNPDGINFAVELWTSGDRSLDASDIPFTQANVYEAREIVEKGSDRYAPGPVPGVTMFARVMAKPGVPMDEIRQRYDRHPLVALRVHIGMETYVRNQLQSASPEDAPPFFGISALYFPTDEALVDRLYIDEAGRQAVMDDVSGFMGAESILFLAESHVLK